MRMDFVLRFCSGECNLRLTLRTVDDMDSAAVLGIAERVAEGKLSMTGAAEFAGNLARDGCVKVWVLTLMKLVCTLAHHAWCV